METETIIGDYVGATIWIPSPIPYYAPDSLNYTQAEALCGFERKMCFCHAYPRAASVQNGGPGYGFMKYRSLKS